MLIVPLFIVIRNSLKKLKRDRLNNGDFFRPTGNNFRP
ncbi:MAG: hypothetical protein ACI8Z9_002428, partial [Paraglaciecola sp.]